MIEKILCLAIVGFVLLQEKQGSLVDSEQLGGILGGAGNKGLVGGLDLETYRGSKSSDGQMIDSPAPFQGISKPLGGKKGNSPKTSNRRPGRPGKGNKGSLGASTGILKTLGVRLK